MKWAIGAVVVLAAGAMGWRLHARRSVVAARKAVGARRSPEEVALQRAAEQRPHDPDPWRRLGQLYLVQRQPFEAVWALEEAVQRGPQDAPALLNLAAALESAQLFHPAIDALAGLLRREPENREARVRRARLSLRLGKALPAIAALRGAGKDLANWPEGLLEMGRARQMDGDLSGAILAYRRQLALAPGSAEGSIRLARALLEQGQLAAARRVLEAGRVNAARDARFPYYLGLSCVQEGLPQQRGRAMDYFTEALAVAPGYPLAHYSMGLLLARQGRWPEAQAHFLQATQAGPAFPDPQLQFARSLEKTGDRARAKENLGIYYLLKDDAYQAANAFRAMEKADPRNVQAPRLVGLADLRLGRNDWALHETQAALQQHPHDVTLLERLATLYILTHSQPLARRVCEAWLKLQPGAARAHWLLGRAAQEDLNLTEAIHEYGIAAAGGPEFPEYLSALAAALNDAGGTANVRRAAELLQQAVRLDPKSVSYRHDLGMALLQLGDLEGARRQLLAALDRDPHHAPSSSGISQLCVRLHEPAMARFFAPLVRAAQDRGREELRLSRHIGQNPTDPEAHAAMAAFLIRTASFPGAQSHLERALALRPDYPEARAALAGVRRVIDVQ